MSEREYIVSETLREAGDNAPEQHYQAGGRADSAEHYYRRAIDRLPKRVYPYYLLAKLYADSSVHSPGRFFDACERALAMEPKVMSPAIKEMRRELIALSDSLEAIGLLPEY